MADALYSTHARDKLFEARQKRSRMHDRHGMGQGVGLSSLGFGIDTDQPNVQCEKRRLGYTHADGRLITSESALVYDKAAVVAGGRAKSWVETTQIAVQQVMIDNDFMKEAGHFKLYDIKKSLAICIRWREPRFPGDEWAMMKVTSQDIDIPIYTKDGIQSCPISSPENPVKYLGIVATILSDPTSVLYDKARNFQDTVEAIAAAPIPARANAKARLIDVFPMGTLRYQFSHANVTQGFISDVQSTWKKAITETYRLREQISTSVLTAPLTDSDTGIEGISPEIEAAVTRATFLITSASVYMWLPGARRRIDYYRMRGLEKLEHGAPNAQYRFFEHGLKNGIPDGKLPSMSDSHYAWLQKFAINMGFSITPMLDGTQKFGLMCQRNDLISLSDRDVMKVATKGKRQKANTSET